MGLSASRFAGNRVTAACSIRGSGGASNLRRSNRRAAFTNFLIDYSFRIDQDDFTTALALARSVNPALSTDIADYAVATVQLRNETRGDAELGLLENALQFIVTK